MSRSRRLACLMVLLGTLPTSAKDWTSADRSFTVRDAELIALVDGKAILEQADGTRYEINVDQLCQADRAVTNIHKSVVDRIEASLSQAREHLNRRQIDQARQAMFMATGLSKAKVLSDKVARSQQFLDDVVEFWEAVRRGFQGLKADDALTLGDQTATVVSTDTRTVVLRVRDKHHRIVGPVPQDFPSSLAVACAKRDLADNDTSRRLVASFLKIDSAAADPGRWAKAIVPAPSGRNIVNNVPRPANRPRAPNNAPLPGTNNPSPAPVPAPAPKKRHPVPSDLQQRQALAELKETMDNEFRQAKTPQKRYDLAVLLAANAAQATSEPVTCYTIAKEAADRFAGLGEFQPALDALALIQQHFDDPELFSHQADVLRAAARSRTKRRDANYFQSLARTAVDLTKKAVAADDYDGADNLLGAALLAARSLGIDLIERNLKRKDTELGRQKNVYNAARRAFQALQADAQDGRANYDVGFYLGVLQGKWDKALPYLAKGNQPDFASAAQRDLAKHTAVDQQILTAEAWSQLADEQKVDRQRMHLLQRAVFWHEQALAKATGAERLRVDSQLRRAKTELDAIDPWDIFPVTIMLGALPVAASSGVRDANRIVQDNIRVMGVSGQPKAKVIWTQPGANQGAGKVSFALSGKYSRLRGRVGFAQTTFTRSSSSAARNTKVVFRMESGGKVIWGTTLASGRTSSFDIDVSGVGNLTLIAACSGSYLYAPAVWYDCALFEK